MKKTVTTVLALLFAISAQAAVGDNPKYAKTITGESIQVFVDAEPYNVVKAAREACEQRGDAFCPSWGGPNIPLTPGGSVTGADYAKVIRDQEKAYKEARAKAREVQSEEAWQTVADLALRTSVKSTVYNRIARRLKNEASTSGLLKKTGVPEGVGGIVHIDRDKIRKAITWYEKAKQAAEAASTMVMESDEKTAEHQALGSEMAAQADRNIAYLNALLTSDRYDADGNHIYRK